MHFPSNLALSLLLAASAGVSAAAADEKPSTTPSPPACTAISKTSGAFYDLRPDIAVLPEEGKTAKSGSSASDYHARGFDYGRNFTLNICAPVADPVEDVVGLGKEDWKNVSAYYTYEDEVYSIGQTSMDLQSHGRMLVLQYTGGSPCGTGKPKEKENDKTKRDGLESSSHDRYKAYDEENLREAADGGDDKKEETPTRRKSATLSFHCEPEQMAGQVGVSFVSADPDDCAYFFEIRSAHACARAEPHQPGSVGPGSVFAIIFVIAVLVYFGGGVFYNRTVEHARGWRQLPNYTLWSGIWNFICFQLRFSPALANKPTAPRPKADASDKKPFDPFENPEKGPLYIEEIAPAHNLVLNKFAIVPEHFILATKDFKAQTHLLEADDLAATYVCIEAYRQHGLDTGVDGELFAFFNSGPHSGASQPHRHVQLLPVAQMRAGLDEPGAWNVLADRLGKGGTPFVTFSSTIGPETSTEELHDLYLTLYRRAVAAVKVHAGESGETNTSGSDKDAEISYNMALTKTQLVICPRLSDGVTTVSGDGQTEVTLSLNGTVLAGTALVKNEVEWDALSKDANSGASTLADILSRIGLPAAENSTGKL
ncbi:hypothetical protein ACHAQA_008184 [Verticillium albo-atrum]